MWKFLSNLLGHSGSSPARANHGTQKTHARVRQDAPVEPIDRFWSKIARLSNPDHRFLHPTYSPGSRVPCADFTPFIIDRLRHGDAPSIRKLMGYVIEANPGLGVGPGWIGQSVDEISSIDFRPYCQSMNPDFFLELKALFILGAKDGGGREFWLTDGKPLLFAWTLCCHDVRWLEALEQLREKANRFIRRMRKDTPFWESYPLFHASEIEYPGATVSRVASILAEFPLMSRMHLLSFAERESAALMHHSTYKMRSLGLNPLETAPSLLASGLCEPTTDLSAIADMLSKSDLLSALDERAISYRKSWKKSKLLECLCSHDPSFISQVIEREKVVRIKPEFLSELHSLSAYANAMQENIKLLCFVDSDS